MHILTQLNYQLSEIEKLLKKDLRDKLATTNLFINENACKLLDFEALQAYLTETDIKNMLLLKTINRKCDDIIEMWNEGFKGLPERALSEPFEHRSDNSYCNFENDFHAIRIGKNTWEFYRTSEQKTRFFTLFHYKRYQLAHIAIRCSAILNYVTACYPETKDYQNLYSSDSVGLSPLGDKEESKTLTLIKEQIEAIDNDGWKYSFHSEIDYNTFTEILTAYFEQREYSLPIEVIKTKRGCKTKLAKALGEILRELGEGVLKKHIAYFEIIMKLSPFEKERDIYKAITR